jgi:aldehyde dehydrogenase (NAD+)
MMQETPTISSDEANAAGAQARADRRLLIDGRLVETERTFPSVNPATGEVLGYAPDATVSDAGAAVAAARRAFDTTDWSTNIELRVHCLEQFHRALIDHRDELAALTIAEVGATPALLAGPQLDQPVDIVRYYAELLKSYPMTEDLGNIESRGMQHHRWVEKEAAGVVAAIIAYNYPNQLALAKLAPALAAGCTVILNAAPDTPLVTLALGEVIANHTDIPPGVVNVLSGADPEVGAVLTTSPEVDMVTFTGSTPTGRRIMAAASDTLKKVFLELGGKSAAIVLTDADPGTVATGVRLASLSNSGQICNALTRILVPAGRADEFTDALAAEMTTMVVGDPTDRATQVGPLVAQRQQQRVRGYIESGEQQGARLVVGGTAMPDGLDRGWYVKPTLFADADNSMRIAREEIFGPVLTVIPYADEDDAIRIANDSDYGLAGSVWTEDIDHGLAVAAAVRTGTFGVNQGYTMDPFAPFGGVKGSGYGRELGREGIDGYTDTKSIAVAGDRKVAAT